MIRNRFCEQCGTELPPGALFCPECGAKQPKESEQEQGRERPDMMWQNEPQPISSSMDTHWQQSWQYQEEEEEGLSVVQCILIGMIAVLLIAMIGFGAYWFLGRNSGKNKTEQAGRQTETELSAQTSDGPNIQVLDQENTQETEKTTVEASSQAQTEMANPQTEMERSQTIQTEMEMSQTEQSSAVQSGAGTAGGVFLPPSNVPVQIVSQSEQPQQEAVQVTNEQAETQQTGFIPDSSVRLIGDSDIQNMSKDDIQMSINEIYARHGRKFMDENVQAYFDKQSWYQGTVEAKEFDNSVFSDIERKNIQFLSSKL